MELRRAVTAGAPCVLAVLAACGPATTAASPPATSSPPASVAATASPPPAGALRSGELIDRVLAAYGGRDQLARVRAYRQEGTVAARSRGAAGSTVRTFVRSDRLRVVNSYPGAIEVRVLAGAAGARGDGGQGLTRVHGPQLAAMMLQRARADVPWILDERRGDVTATPMREQDGTEWIRLDLPLGQGLSLHAFVDPRTNEIRRSMAVLHEARMAARFETRYADFRLVGGVKMAFHEETFANGVHTATTTFTKVELNPVTAEADFALPAVVPDRSL